MRLRVLLFAAVRQSAQQDWIDVDVAEDSPVAGDVLAAVADQLPAIAPLIPSCRLAVDDSYVGNNTPIDDTSIIALIPPTSGG
ncbi:ThiS family protein [Stieleria varia]|uniref:ThiS family protein n=2 Tax=Stieleria varia TaxID=2528005 RepID=A0A5C6BAQ1_9BACT|nr:ThiS family protein [Stieleria varia]